MAQVTRDTNIGDLLRIDMGVAPILMGKMCIRDSCRPVTLILWCMAARIS